MKRTIALILCMALTMVLAGCATGSDSRNHQTGDEEMEFAVMTQQEIELLSKAYADAERIREGKLFRYQQEGLAQLRAGMAYLQAKYPTNTPEVIGFAPATKFTPWAQLTLQGADAQTYLLKVTPQEGEYICEDTYYGALLRANYDAYVEGLLGMAGIDARAFTRFLEPKGMEVDGSISVESFVALRPCVSRDTHLYVVDAVDRQWVQEAVQSALKEGGLYGTYILYFVPADSYAQGAAMDAQQQDWPYVSFSCFDIG